MIAGSLSTWLRVEDPSDRRAGCRGVPTGAGQRSTRRPVRGPSRTPSTDQDCRRRRASTVAARSSSRSTLSCEPGRHGGDRRGLAPIDRPSIGTMPESTAMRRPRCGSSATPSATRVGGSGLLPAVEHEVGRELVVDELVDARLQSTGQHRDRRDQREPDHQGRLAVDAVRRGLRSAFSRAMRPTVPESGANGAVTTRTTGRGQQRGGDEHAEERSARAEADSLQRRRPWSAERDATTAPTPSTRATTRR